MADDESRRIKLAASCNSSVRNDCSGFNWNNPQGSAHTYPVALTSGLAIFASLTGFPLPSQASVLWLLCGLERHARGFVGRQGIRAGVAGGWRVKSSEQVKNTDFYSRWLSMWLSNKEKPSDFSRGFSV